jgi:hypothetical protein
MKNSKDGSSGGSDGRKNNKPPEHGKIKKGEVRNKWGRAGKPDLQPPTIMDELLWAEACRIVSYDGDNPVQAMLRLLQEEFQDALVHGDKTVRDRLITRITEAAARIEGKRKETLNFVYEVKAALSDEFHFARKIGRPAPNVVPHPDHVVIEDGLVHFIGPTTCAEREWWEDLKAAIAIAACLHDIIRSEHRRTSCHAVFEELRSIEAHRRKLMRMVPKGWNWREELYCRTSQLEFICPSSDNLRLMAV